MDYVRFLPILCRINFPIVLVFLFILLQKYKMRSYQIHSNVTKESSPLNLKKLIEIGLGKTLNISIG